MKVKETVEKAQNPPKGPAQRCAASVVAVRVNKHNWVLQFSHAHFAEALFDLLIQRLPLLNTEYPKINYNEVELTGEQYLFYQRQIMQEDGEITTRYLDESLLKTLRADEFDFSLDFMRGIIPGEKGARRYQNLRPTPRSQYIIRPNGNVSLRHHKKSMYTPEEKKCFSQIQSSTLIDEYALTGAFGILRDKRAHKVYGLMTHIADVRISRALLNDGGTVVRPFESRYLTFAETLSTNLQCYSDEKFIEFKVANIRERQTRKFFQRTNEVLARLSFNPHRSVVCICSDTLEARLLAYDFSLELLEHYAIYAESTGRKLNPHFKIPIIFYVSKNTKTDQPNEAKHDLWFYTDEMLKKDQVEALEIFQDEARRAEHYRQHNYEFLLGLPEITRDILLDECLGEPLAFAMLKAGYTRILLRLLRPTHAKSTLRGELFDALIASPAHYFQRNDPIIAKLILLEAFDLADKLLLATSSKKEEVRVSHDGIIFNGELLADFLIKNGNPRQLNYMGLENMLIKAAEKGFWVTVKLCLKEYSLTNKSILDQLLHFAQKQKQHSESTFIMTVGLVTSVNDNVVVREAADREDWLQVRLLIQNPNIVIHKSMYDYLLIEAVSCGEEVLARSLLQAGAEPSWRYDDPKYYLCGTLYYAVSHNLIKLLPLLIEYEKQCQDEYSADRNLFALDVARCKQSKAVDLLEKNINTAAVFDPANPEKSICRLVLQALSVEKFGIAEWQLLKYCHQFQLLPENNDNFADALRIIMKHFIEIMKSMPFLNFENIIIYIVKEFLYNGEVCAFASLVSSPAFNDSHPSRIYIETLTYKIILEQLNYSNNIPLIRKISEHLCALPVDQNTCSHKLLWGEALSKAFKEEIERLPGSENRAICLIELGVFLSGWELASAFSKALATNANKLARYIVEDCVLDNIDKKPYLLNILMSRAEHIETFYPHLGQSITLSHLDLFVQNSRQSKEVLIKLLQSIDQKQYCNNSHLWVYYKVFKFGFFSDDFQVQQQLMSMLSPSLIRHMMLIFLLESYCKRGIVGNASIVKTRPNISQAIASKYDLYQFYPADDKFTQKDFEILDILESYFVNIDEPSEESIINNTFTKVLRILESTLGSSTYILRLFGAKSSNDAARCQYMQKIDQELSKVEKNRHHQEFLSELISAEVFPTNDYFRLYLTAIIALLVVTAVTYSSINSYSPKI
ncbi:MAG: hypothetical protein K2X50_08165 [Gammaproteobacteria bacterium]|nr:hypothetical protein [Gammaproteobacteria bacterium]